MNNRGEQRSGKPRTTRAIAAVVTEIAQACGVDLTKVGEHRRIENEPWMALSIEVIGQNLISLAHYGVQQGDLMADPEIVFWTGLGAAQGWVPVSCRQDYVGRYRVACSLAQGEIVGFMPREVADQCHLANVWARNLKEQGFIAAARKTATGDES